MLENPQDPSTTRIVCDLPPREGSKGSDWFSLILKVDGEEVPNRFVVRYLLGNTPLVRKVRTDLVPRPHLSHTVTLDRTEVRQAGRPDHHQREDLHQGVRELQLQG